MKKISITINCLLMCFVFLNLSYAQNTKTYPIVDTGISAFYSDKAIIKEPKENTPFYGQDAHYNNNSASYTDNNDGTITDNITGLMWQKDMGEKITFANAQKFAQNFALAGYSDWRIPTIKELYSLINFTGESGGASAKVLYIDTKYFNQPLGDITKEEREIDAQTWSSTQYAGKTMGKDETIFGVNFIDGRIKGYPKLKRGQENTAYFRLVRGNTQYGKNNFIDNNDGTISDLATGLMWQKEDSKKGLDWKDALAFAESLKLANYTDWRLPNAKELQSIVDYERSLQRTNSPAIDPLFFVSEIKDTNDNKQYPYYWTATSHLDGNNPYNSAVYIAFGEAQGIMHNNLLDVHGAGAQRSDPKSGRMENYPQSFGPQGDIRRVYNYVRAVRDME